mmetsp:Transcript_29542/g.74310  ORF Transcript_29542/g.74310 Transcript_29542/m.74310 type:complete len:217 (+) Transcript_29542:613-1263(+)
MAAAGCSENTKQEKSPVKVPALAHGCPAKPPNVLPALSVTSSSVAPRPPTHASSVLKLLPCLSLWKSSSQVARCRAGMPQHSMAASAGDIWQRGEARKASPAAHGSSAGCASTSARPPASTQRSAAASSGLALDQAHQARRSSAPRPASAPSTARATSAPSTPSLFSATRRLPSSAAASVSRLMAPSPGESPPASRWNRYSCQALSPPRTRTLATV